MTGVRWSEEDLAAFNARRTRAPASPRRSIHSEPVAHNSGAPDRPDAGAGAGSDKARQPIQRPKGGAKSYPEEELQKACAEILDTRLRADHRWLHIPNQRGTRKAWEQKLFSALGVKAGAADILIFKPDARFVWIELKSDVGTLSEDQQGWRDWCHSIGACWFLVRSEQDLLDACADAGVVLHGAGA